MLLIRLSICKLVINEVYWTKTHFNLVYAIFLATKCTLCCWNLKNEVNKFLCRRSCTCSKFVLGFWQRQWQWMIWWNSLFNICLISLNTANTDIQCSHIISKLNVFYLHALHWENTPVKQFNQSKVNCSCNTCRN